MGLGFNYDYKNSGMNAQLYRSYSDKNKNAFLTEYEKSKNQLSGSYIKTETEEMQKKNNINPKLEAVYGELEGDPIASRADENGFLLLNGVPIHVNNVERTISIGDVSDMNDVFSVPLSTGYTLNVGRDSISELADVIDEFKPEDVRRILHALETYKHLNEKMDELEDLYSKICESLDKRSSESENGDNIKSRSQINNDNDNNKSETNSNIVVNSDGTRTLLVTTHTPGGLVATFSLKLSNTNELDSAKEMEQYKDKFQQMNLLKTQTAIAAYEN